MKPTALFAIALTLGSGACSAVFPSYTTAMHRPPPGMIEDRLVTAAPENVWQIRVLEADLPPSRIDGRDWDSDGAPDLFVVVRRNGEEIYRTPVVANNLRPQWTNAAVTMVVNPNDALRVELLDDDGPVNDHVGLADFHGIPAEARDGGNWLVQLDNHTTLRLAASAPTPMLGMGVTYAVHEDYLAVQEVVPGSPAATQGIVVGDRITAIDGHSVVTLGEVGSRQAMDRASLRGGALMVTHAGRAPESVQVEPGAVYPAR